MVDKKNRSNEEKLPLEGRDTRQGLRRTLTCKLANIMSLEEQRWIRDFRPGTIRTCFTPSLAVVPVVP